MLLRLPSGEVCRLSAIGMASIQVIEFLPFSKEFGHTESPSLKSIAFYTMDRLTISLFIDDSRHWS